MADAAQGVSRLIERKKTKQFTVIYRIHTKLLRFGFMCNSCRVFFTCNPGVLILGLKAKFVALALGLSSLGLGLECYGLGINRKVIHHGVIINNVILNCKMH